MVIGLKGRPSSINVSDLKGRVYTAARPGDYIYPKDVRFDAREELLYVKADGLAGGMYRETLLFEYDLRSQRLLAHGRVDNNILPRSARTQRNRVYRRIVA
jgi:hypothetical protein